MSQRLACLLLLPSWVACGAAVDLRPAALSNLASTAKANSSSGGAGDAKTTGSDSGTGQGGSAGTSGGNSPRRCGVGSCGHHRQDSTGSAGGDSYFTGDATSFVDSGGDCSCMGEGQPSGATSGEEAGSSSSVMDPSPVEGFDGGTASEVAPDSTSSGEKNF